jgi:hypothetical protein
MLSRFALVTLLASSALHATSSTSASCTLGTTTQTVTGATSSSCSIPIIIDGNYLGFAGASAEVTGSLSETGFLGVEGSGGISFSGSSLPGGGGGSGEATYSHTFDTPGPLRPGFYSAITSGFGGYWNATITQNGVTSELGNGPIFFIELGEPFQIYLTANGGGGWSPGCPSNCDSAGDSSAGVGAFQLTEADGNTAVPYFAIVTPEPASRGCLLFGLTAFAVLYIRARKLGSGALEASAPNSNP